MSMDKQAMIDRLSDLEWEDFQKLNNIGGRANCQNNRGEFDANRKSQFASWNDATLESYLRDVEASQIKGRNLVWERYARMMESTSPLEYSLIADKLPALSGLAKELTEDMVAKQVEWQDELAAEYPRLFARSRVIHSRDDTPLACSFETYLRCELLTYSEETLTRYSAHMEDCAQKGVSMNRVCMDEMVRRFGYASLESAEAAT